MVLNEPIGSPAAFEVKTAPAPNGGLNKIAGLANMPVTDAVQLINWLPDIGGVRSRKGYSEWSTLLGAAVGAVFPYFNQSTAFPGGAFLVTPTSMPGFLFASTDAAIYDITNSAVGPPPVAQALSGATNAGWISSIQMVNSAGTTFLLVCSETDGYFYFNGAAWFKITLGGGANQVSVTDPTAFVQVAIFKRRAWFVVRDTSKAAYLTVDAVTGAGAYFDFGPQFKHGGHLEYLANWTIDAGEGIDDFLVAVGSNGDVVIYKGTDPSSATTFALVGTWFVGQVPVGRRGCVQYGGDLVIVSADGIFPISYITRGGSDFLVASQKEYASQIRPLIGQDLRSSFTNRGWQMVIHPSERLMLVNVPDYGSSQQLQYAMSTSLNKWAQFSGIPIYSLGSSSGYTFAGTTDGRVLLLFNGYQDNLVLGATSGNDISGLIVPAFNYFDTPALEKQFLGIRPVFIGTTQPTITVDISVNFRTTLPNGIVPGGTTLGGIWASGLWGVAIWGGSQAVFDEWATCGDTGYAGAATLVTAVRADTTLVSIDYMFQVGGPLGTS